MKGYEAIWLAFMVWNSLSDIRKKQISFLSCLLAGGIGIIAFTGEKMESSDMRMDFWQFAFEMLLRSLPGCFLLSLSFIGKKAIGVGDGLVVVITGLFFNAAATTEILFWGFLTSAVFGIFLMIFRKAGRKTEIPFVPFLLLGYFLRAVI